MDEDSASGSEYHTSLGSVPSNRTSLTTSGKTSLYGSSHLLGSDKLLFYTAKTGSTLKSQIISIQTSSGTSGILENDDDWEDYESDDDDEEEGTEAITIHLDHRPPVTTQDIINNRLGNINLRQLITARQSARLLPPSDQVVERMEDQMVRWSVPQSCFRVNDILNGKHAFQKAGLGVLDVVKDDKHPACSKSSGSAAESTETIQTLKCKPTTEKYSTLKSDTTLRQHTVIQEPNSGSDKSLRENARLKDEETLLADSASFSSSMLRKINGDATPTEDNKEQVQGVVIAAHTSKTLEALPLDDEDINNMVKDQPRLHPSHIIALPSSFPRTMEYRLDATNDDDVSCWLVFKDILDDLWNDMLECVSCNYTFLDQDERQQYGFT